MRDTTPRDHIGRAILQEGDRVANDALGVRPGEIRYGIVAQADPSSRPHFAQIVWDDDKMRGWQVCGTAHLRRIPQRQRKSVSTQCD